MWFCTELCTLNKDGINFFVIVLTHKLPRQRKMAKASPDSYRLHGWCNTTHPRDIPFRVKDVIVVRIIDAHSHRLVNATVKRSALMRMLMHYAIEIYVRETGCVFSLGLYENRKKKITVQTPDKIVALSCKPKHKDNAYGAISEKQVQTVAQRIKELRREKALFLTTELNSGHIKLLKMMMRRCQPHPRFLNTWVFLPTQPHPYKIATIIHNTFNRRKRPLTHKQRKAYQCQTFALEFVRRPNVLANIYL